MIHNKKLTHKKGTHYKLNTRNTYKHESYT